MLMSSKKGGPDDGSAKLQYGPGGFRVLSSGKHVFCAMSGDVILLEDLRYWSVEHQEAYATCELATRRLTEQS